MVSRSKIKKEKEIDTLKSEIFEFLLVIICALLQRVKSTRYSDFGWSRLKMVVRALFSRYE